MKIELMTENSVRRICEQEIVKKLDFYNEQLDILRRKINELEEEIECKKQPPMRLCTKNQR